MVEYTPSLQFLYVRLYLKAIILSILLTASPIYSHPELISILSWYCCFYVWFIFMNMYICVPYIYVFYFVRGQYERMKEQFNWMVYPLSPPPPPPPPRFSIFQSICTTPNFKSWIRPWYCILSVNCMVQALRLNKCPRLHIEIRQ